MVQNIEIEMEKIIEESYSLWIRNINNKKGITYF